MAYDLGKLARLQRQRDRVDARWRLTRDALHEHRQELRRAADECSRALLHAQGLGRVGNDKEVSDLDGWTPEQLKKAGIAVESFARVRELRSAIGEYETELAAIDRELAPLRRLVSACEAIAQPGARGLTTGERKATA